MKDYTLTDTQLKVLDYLERALLACKDENVLIWFYGDSLAAVNGNVVLGIDEWSRTEDEVDKASVTFVKGDGIGSTSDDTLYITWVKV